MQPEIDMKTNQNSILLLEVKIKNSGDGVCRVLRSMSIVPDFLIFFPGYLYAEDWCTFWYLKDYIYGAFCVFVCNSSDLYWIYIIYLLWLLWICLSLAFTADTFFVPVGKCQLRNYVLTRSVLLFKHGHLFEIELSSAF